jgi:cytochrome c oxidase subunit II
MARHVKPMFTIAMLVTILFTAGCVGTSSVFQPASPGARDISQLIQIVFGIAAVVFLIVEGLLFYTAFRFGRKQGSGLPNQIEGNNRLEVGWTIFPAVILAIVFFVSLGPLRSVAYTPAPGSGASPSGPGSTLHVRAIGHQWWWEFNYPDLHITTANELHVPVGTTVTVDVESVDVIHSFWVPELGGKIDAIPGHANKTWFQVEKTGNYFGQCAEFCGVEHALMRILVVADNPDQFNAWVKNQQTQPQPPSGDAALGQEVFLSGSCMGCHTVDGTKAKGLVGPNLTHFASRQTFAGAVQDNTPGNLANWLADPQAVKPGALMPNLHLSSDKVQLLVNYLESLK